MHTQYTHTVTFIKAFITQFAWLRINTQQGGLLSLNTRRTVTHTHTHTRTTRSPKKVSAWASSKVQHHAAECSNTSWRLPETCRYVRYLSTEERCYVRNWSGSYEAESRTKWPVAEGSVYIMVCDIQVFCIHLNGQEHLYLIVLDNNLWKCFAQQWIWNLNTDISYGQDQQVDGEGEKFTRLHYKIAQVCELLS